MKIAISGKGGVGKTTISGTLCRLFGRRNLDVLAIDGDPNPNLSVVLGVKRQGLMPLNTKLLERFEDEEGKRRVRLAVPITSVLNQYGVQAPDRVTLVMVGKPDHAGTGCMCGAHTVVREVIHAAVAASDRLTVLDMEASLEHMKRGTARHVDALYIVVEPYYRSLEAAHRLQALGTELGIPHVAAIANKVRTPEDEAAIRTFCEQRGLAIHGVIPFDEAVTTADRTGHAFIEQDGPSKALPHLSDLADRILALRPA